MGNTAGQRAGGRDPREHLNDEVLNAYLDQTDAGLSPTARDYAAAHLADCAACRTALDELATTVAILGALPDIPLRRSFILTPEAAAATGGPRLPRQLPRWVWPTRWATALAAVIFAVTIGLDLGGSGAAPAPAANAPTAQATVAGTPPTSCTTRECLTSFVDPTSIIIFPTPTAIAQPAPTPQGRPITGETLRPVQVASGLLTLLGAGCGFVLPATLRRRHSA
jgi:hypothetical protein